MEETLAAVVVPSRLDLEATVRAGEGWMREWLLALLALHDRKLYTETHTSWEAYVFDTFGYSRSTANRWLVQGREVLALEAAPEDKVPGQRVPRAGHLPTQRQAARSQKDRRTPIRVASEAVPTPAPGPSVDDLVGSDPGFTGGRSAEDYVRGLRGGADEEVPGNPDPAIQRPTNPAELEDPPPPSIGDEGYVCPQCGPDRHSLPVPTVKSQVAHLIDHLQDLDPTDFFGSATDGQLDVLRRWARQGIPADEADVIRWMKAKSDQQVRAIGDPYGPAIRAEVQRWSRAFGYEFVGEDSLKRRQGTISRPADRRKAKLAEPNPTMASPLAEDEQGSANGGFTRSKSPVDPHNCTHPKDQKKTLPYGNFCGRCNTRIP